MIFPESRKVRDSFEIILIILTNRILIVSKGLHLAGFMGVTWYANVSSFYIRKSFI